jgi:predicted ATP-grasp superfamily ATP-dependent carboligase
LARHLGTARGTETWLADADIRDVPRPGTRIVRGAPVCTVFASASTAAECYEHLRSRAAAVYGQLRRWREAA